MPRVEINPDNAAVNISSDDYTEEIDVTTDARLVGKLRIKSVGPGNGERVAVPESPTIGLNACANLAAS